MTDNLWIATDFGPCKRECQYAHQPINAQDLCESCYYAQRCPMDGCKNIWHIDGEGLCSLHELETAREIAHGNRIKTERELKPIPDRNYDWSAWRGGSDIGMHIGYGVTEAAAIEALRDSEDEDEDVDANDAAQIALWEARVAADETLPTADKVKAAQPDIMAAPFSPAWMKSVLGYGRAA